MQSASPLLAPDMEGVDSLCARAMAIRHREHGAALELAERAAAFAAGDAGRAGRRARAALGAVLACQPPLVPRARQVLRAALAECEAAGDDGLRCEVLNELGITHANGYEFDPALRYGQEAVETARALGRTGEQARALRLVGTALTGTGDFARSLSVLLEALALHESLAGGAAEALDDEALWERGKLFGRIAICYSNLDQFERALSYYQVALEIFGDRFPLSAARTLYRMGIAADELKDVARAEGFYRRCLESYEREGNATGAALGKLGLAHVLTARGELDEAEALARAAVEGLGSDPMHRVSYHADAVWTLGDVFLRRGRPAEALACYEEAMAAFVKAERPASHTAVLYGRLSGARAALGRFAEALADHQRFHELTVEHLQARAGARVAAMMAQFDTERAVKDREIHRLRNVELEREIAERKEAEAALARARDALEEANRELHALTIRDPLTGAFNRRYLDQRLAEALPLAVRGVQPLSVMMCDIDDFKRINDSFSHAVGDEVLRVVAGILRRNVRQSDVVARFGGEEFVVLFPATALEQATAAGEKVCRLVREHPWHALHPRLSVTMSAGVAAADTQPTHEKLLADADRKLYQAKRRGKNRVVV
jgi:diguanylate cyclase (GGDEF)-like protein